MDELTAQQKELTTSIAEKELASGFRLTRDHIKYFLGQFKNKNYKDRECQKQLINTFVNSVFLYDDHIDINFNYSGGSRTLSLTESEEKGGSEGFVCCLPCSTLVHRRFLPAVVFLFEKSSGTRKREPIFFSLDEKIKFSLKFLPNRFT